MLGILSLNMSYTQFTFRLEVQTRHIIRLNLNPLLPRQAVHLSIQLPLHVVRRHVYAASHSAFVLLQPFVLNFNLLLDLVYLHVDIFAFLKFGIFIRKSALLAAVDVCGSEGSSRLAGLESSTWLLFACSV